MYSRLKYVYKCDIVRQSRTYAQKVEYIQNVEFHSKRQEKFMWEYYNVSFTITTSSSLVVTPVDTTVTPGGMAGRRDFVCSGVASRFSGDGGKGGTSRFGRRRRRRGRR